MSQRKYGLRQNNGILPILGYIETEMKKGKFAFSASELEKAGKGVLQPGSIRNSLQMHFPDAFAVTKDSFTLKSDSEWRNVNRFHEQRLYVESQINPNSGNREKK